jgi:hypothetical protein
MNDNLGNFVVLKDRTLYFVGFELLHDNVAIPKGYSRISLRCCKKDSADIGEFIEIEGQKSRSASLIDYFMEHNAIRRRFMLIDDTYYLTDNSIELGEEDIDAIIAQIA